MTARLCVIWNASAAGSMRIHLIKASKTGRLNFADRARRCRVKRGWQSTHR